MKTPRWNPVGTMTRAWRSTRLAKFISDFNQRPDGPKAPAGLLPTRDRRKLLLSAAGLTLVAIAVRAPLLGKAYVAPDTSAYLEVAEHIFHGGFINNLRPPGYSLLLAVFEELGTHPTSAVVYLQNVIGIFLPASVLFVGWRFFSPPVGIIAGFLTAASPLMIITEQLGLAEFLFGVLLLGATVLLVEAVLRIRAGQTPWKLLAVTGAVFGIATLLRANGLLALVAIPIVLWIAARRWRPALKASGVAVGVMLAVLAPWCIHNLIAFGNPNVATVEDISLYARAVTWDRVPPPHDTADGRLALDLYNAEAPPTALFDALVGEGKTSTEATNVMRELALGAISEHPDIYLTDSWYALGEYRELFNPRTLTASSGVDQIAVTRHYFEGLRRSGDRGSIPKSVLAGRSRPGSSALTRVPWQIAQTLTRLLYLISIGGLLILLLPFIGAPRQRLTAMVLLVILILGVLGSSLSSVFSPRYDVVFAPFVWLLLAATTVRIFEVIIAAVGRWLAPSGGGVPLTMAIRSRLSRGGKTLLGWVDAGRSSLVLALALALVIPSVNAVTFDGLPLDSPWEVGALAALLPFVFSSSLRASLASTLRRRVAWGARALIIATTAVIVIKVLLLGVGSDRGFIGCYSSTWKPPPQRCEESYSNLLKRHDGATRVDEEIDFGPSDEQASRLDEAFPSLAYKSGAGSTNWDLSFANDLRFNEAPSETGLSLHELMPFDASWQGTAAIPDDGVLRIQYVGGGSVRVGEKRILLPPWDSSHTIVAHVPSGKQPLKARFSFPQGASSAEFRLLDQSGNAIGAAAPSILEQLAALLVWLVLGVAFLGMVVVSLSALRRDLLALGLVAIAALLITAFSSPEQHLGFQYLVALLAPIIVMRPPRRPILWAFAALLVIEGAAVLNGVSDLHSVLYHQSGSDFLTYESFARNVVLGHSLEGGESVFYYQPGSRYLLGLMHLVFGDGNVLLTWWSMIALSLPFVALIGWQRRRTDSSLGRVAIAIAGFLLLAVINSPTVLSLVALNASEVPTWALLPLAIAAPQLQPSRRRAWIGSAAAAGLIYTIRNNQALAVGTILAAIAAGLWKRRRGVLLAAAGVALAIAALPAIHNLAYGQRLIFSTTSSALSQELSISDLGRVFSNSAIGEQVRGHISALLYDPPTPGLTSGSLAWLLWGMLAFWLAAIVMSMWRLVRGESSLRTWLLLLVPVAYLAPHLIYQVEVYFPRHIIAGYLAMGVVALGTFAEALSSGREWSLATGTRAVTSFTGARLTALRGARPMRSVHPDAARGGIARATSGYISFQRTGIGLVIAAVLAPFSATHIAGPLTLGRAALILFAGLLAADLLRERPRCFRLDKPALLVICGYVGLCGWIFLNTAAWGCNCDGKAGGFYEFALIGLLALIAIGFEPRLRGPAIVATLVGVAFACALALLGFGALNSGTVDLTQTGGRLSGTFGNANELGFAAALAIPIALAYRSAARTRMRLIAFVAALLILLATLLLTYSRGGIIAAAVGILALALWEARASRRRVLLILGVASVCALVGAGLYSLFERERRDVSFETVSPTLAPLSQRDLSGWDSRALGPIPDGPSKLSNEGEAIAVRSDHHGEGASFRWGEASRNRTYTLRFRARAQTGKLPFNYALGDSGQPAGRVRARTELGLGWHRYSLVWRPRLRSPHANLYLWQEAGPSQFSLADIRVTGGRPGQAPAIIDVPGRLRGSIYGRLTSEATREESRYVQSRLDAARLAFRAFKSEPLRGIGWATFPAYSAAHSHYGQLAAHNEYLGIAAELGIIGLMLLILFFAGLVIGVRRAGPTKAEAAAVGVLAAALVGLIFVEALPVPQLSISLAMAAAIVCAPRRRSDPD